MQLLSLLSETLNDYHEVDRRQRTLHGEIAAGEAPDTIIYSEFAPVYTAGSRTAEADIVDRSVPVVRIDRGGSVTYHGPGQLVAYPILRVEGRQDVVAFVRALEQAVIDLVAEFDVLAERVPDRTGVWIVREGQPDRKLCAIGVRFAKRTTMHGLALNVSTNTAEFGRIVPCGIQDAGVVSLADLGVRCSVAEAAARLHPHLQRELLRFRAPSRISLR